MRPNAQGVNVTIMGREFSVACPEKEREALTLAAMHLDRRMREIQKSGKVVSLERCAIIAGLNIMHELLNVFAKTEENEKISARMKLLHEKINSAMQEQKQLSL